MSFQDKSLKCTDCGTNFTFTSGEQEFFATKGYTNEPKRCPGCRKAKKLQNGGSSYESRSYSGR
ncbi:MAG: zinc-ribbon domain-containing protein [Dehalococcoidia bacterium]